MNRPLLSLLLSAVVLTSPASACMNDYVPNVAAIERSKSVLDQLQKHVEKEPWDVRRDRLRKELAAGGDYKVKNDLAVALAHTGDAAGAVTLLEQIETEKPGLYGTAANLGTAYELSGNDEKALEWIKKGIERNPDSHEGTEWLHVRILEAKLSSKDNPKWLQSHSVIAPDRVIGAEIISVIGNNGETLSPDLTKRALIYQLHERLQFVKPPDAIVGALLLDLGYLVSKEPIGTGGAYDIFHLANTYLDGLPDLQSLQLQAELNAVHAEMYGQRKPHGKVPLVYLGDPATIVLVGLLLSLPIIVLKRLIQRKLARTGTQPTA